MTHVNDLAGIASEVETLSADLRKVNAAIDTIGKPAIEKASEIAAALNDAKDRLATALADQASAERNNRLKRFSDIRVETKADENDNLLSTGFVIRYKQDTWDMNLKESVPKDHECNGFAALVDDAYEYLLTEKPEAIPAVIMALAPGKPHEAMRSYLTAKARGYLRG